MSVAGRNGHDWMAFETCTLVVVKKESVKGKVKMIELRAKSAHEGKLVTIQPTTFLAPILFGYAHQTRTPRHEKMGHL